MNTPISIGREAAEKWFLRYGDDLDAFKRPMLEHLRVDLAELIDKIVRSRNEDWKRARTDFRDIAPHSPSLRETAERIIEGVPKSYRDGDEEAGHERTVKWLMDLLRERVAIPPVVRLAIRVLLNHIEEPSGWINCKATVENWLEAQL